MGALKAASKTGRSSFLAKMWYRSKTENLPSRLKSELTVRKSFSEGLLSIRLGVLTWSKTAFVHLGDDKLLDLSNETTELRKSLA